MVIMEILLLVSVLYSVLKDIIMIIFKIFVHIIALKDNIKYIIIKPVLKIATGM